MKINNRLNLIKEYHFKNLNLIKERALEKGIELIDLSIGDSSLEVNPKILETLVLAMSKEEFNMYPPYEGIKELKNAVREYYKENFNVTLGEDEVVILIGSKEGINNLVPALCDTGDYVILPNPAYPVYYSSTVIWGCEPYKVPLYEKNNYLPKIEDIPKNITKRAKLFFINYPNNPTGAIATEKFYKDLVEYCDLNEITLCNDGAYNEIIKSQGKALSLLQFDKNKNHIEMGSLSKPYNMTGFRIAYAVGNREVISALLKIKSNVDSGQFKPIQYAAMEALKLGSEYINSIRAIYDERRVEAEKILREKNIEFFKAEGSFYIWCKTPKGYSTSEFCEELINKYGIIVTPGVAFGNISEGYFRIALTQEVNLIKKALNKLTKY